MPTVLRVGAMRVVIYPNDHPPAHVHVVGPGWVVVVDLIRMDVRGAIGCNEQVAARALRAVEARRDMLMEAWRRIHG